MTIENVPSFATRLDATADVPSLGTVRYELAFGGNFYAILPPADLDIPFDRAVKDRILAAGLDVMAAIDATDRPKYPVDPTISGCKHVQFTAPGVHGSDSRNAMAIHLGWFDPSLCGTGTSARLAQLHARGELDRGVDFVNESLLGARFTGRLARLTGSATWRLWWRRRWSRQPPRQETPDLDVLARISAEAPAAVTETYP